MQRRSFLKNSTMAGAAVAGLSVLSATASPVPTTEDQAAPNDPEFALHEATIDELQEKMASGRLTAVAIAQLYLERIAKVDKTGAGINAVIELNPDALAIAASLDKERKDGKVRGPMHGIPILIKDNIDTADSMQTTAGSLAMAGHIARKDAFVVAQLRKAGAVLLGKTNLSEWANFRSTNSSSGWSSRGGQTLSPYILTHNPCGSSSGSGVAVAANLCTVAVGTETDGSVTCPASTNSLVGLKPTVGLVSRSGIIPISASQDTAGPMARTVSDMATLLSAMVGADPEDAATLKSKGKADYSKHLKADGLKGKRIGVDRTKPSRHDGMNALLETCLSELTRLGATIVDVKYVDAISALGGYELEILQTEFKAGLNAYLAASNAPVKNLAALIAYNKANGATTMQFFKQEQLENSARKTDLKSAAYIQALQKGRVGAQKIINNLLQTKQLDAIAGLTMGPACAIDVVYGDRWSDDFLTQPAAMAGYPHITVPGGFLNRLPVGLSFFSGAYTEAGLIELAYAYEQATKKRMPPRFIPHFFAP
ncbi:MAG: amidase [Bacteroidetes bacterium]|nr:MAG: amidase [Bacteroidota bacterium]